jgi:hypothetical protein
MTDSWQRQPARPLLSTKARRPAAIVLGCAVCSYWQVARCYYTSSTPIRSTAGLTCGPQPAWPDTATHSSLSQTLAKKYRSS